MFNRMTSAGGSSKFQLMIGALILVVLFVVGFQISNLLSNPVSQPADQATPATTTTGGVALVNPPQQLHDFTLTSKTGDPITLSSLRGKTVVLFFGYTHCPDECPTTMADFERAKKLLGDQADQVRFVFVSVDGQRDTPEQMTKFLDQFDTDFVGMTGSAAQLREIGTEYGLVFSDETIGTPQVSDDEDEASANGDTTPLDDQNYFVQHTSPSFLIDRTGKLQMVAFYRTQPDVLVTKIRQLLQQSS